MLTFFQGRRSTRGSASLAGTILRVEAHRLRVGVTSSLRAVTWLRSSTPSRLVIAPQDIRTADPTIASDIYAGHLVFGGGFIDAHGLSPFELTPPSDAWAETLHGFGWLRHLRAADSALARANARALVEDWLVNVDRRSNRVAWRPKVVARRLLSWVAQSPTILASNDGAFYRRFMRSIGRQSAFLQRSVAAGLFGEDRLFAAIALVEIGLCAEGMATARRVGTRLLCDELSRQILPDGGHISRNPGVLVEILLDLLPLRQAFATRGTPVPPPLLNAIDRIMPMIRLFRYGDGSLALFNGMGPTQHDVLATLLSYDDVHSRPLSSATHSGYQRLEAGVSLVVCDVAKPPPRLYSGRAHAGTLSFELTIGAHRLIVNCGRPAGSNRRTNEAARSTAAHSALVVADASSSRFASEKLHRWLGEQIVSGPRQVEATRTDDGDGQGVAASHDGYGPRFGLVHRRSLRLSQSGDQLTGEDRLVPQGTRGGAAENFAIRFHLHPTVRAALAEDDRAVFLTLPNDETWVFDAGGFLVELDESVFFAATEGGRRTLQIVIFGTFPGQDTVAWRLRRAGRSAVD